MRKPPDFAAWLELLRGRRLRLLPAWDGPDLTADERRLIARSIATFQLGESSEGRHLVAAARRFAAREQIAELVELTRLFIREEQLHAAVLGGFMDRNGISRLCSQYSDNIFRWLRRPFGFEIALRVLVTAELIAMTYYRALGAATRSKMLCQICELLLADEEMHLRYQSQVLRWACTRHAWPGRAGIATFHACLYLGAVLVVYAGHAAVLRAAGYGFASFFASCWGYYRCWRQHPESDAQAQTTALPKRDFGKSGGLA